MSICDNFIVPLSTYLVWGAIAAVLVIPLPMTTALVTVAACALAALLCVYRPPLLAKRIASAGSSKSVAGACVLAGLLLFVLYPEVVSAQTIGDIADNVEDSVVSIRSLALNAGYALGLIILIYGLYLLWKDRNESGRGHATKGLVAMAVGFLMILIPGTIQIIGDTLSVDTSDVGENIRETDAARNY